MINGAVMLFSVLVICPILLQLKVDNRYHGACGKQFFKRISTQQSSKGRPENVEVTAAFDFVCNYIENDEDQCQF